MTNNGNILWVDDEIELLKAHILFLEKKGYDVTTVSNGADAIDQCHQHTFDLIMLDEMMPGLSGLETLQQIKDISPATPVVMVTKSEEENIMEQAIGSKIADYLIKPVNPSQILLSLKKNIHRKEIVTEVTQNSYQQNFQQLSLQIEDCRNFEDWKTVYKKLVHWELELSSADSSMTEILKTQKEEADNAFAKFIKKNYMDWVSPQKTSGIGNMRNMMQHKLASRHSMPTSQTEDKPLMSPDVFKRKVFPLLDNKKKVFLIVIDNFHDDQWRVLAQ